MMNMLRPDAGKLVYLAIGFLVLPRLLKFGR